MKLSLMLASLALLVSLFARMPDVIAEETLSALKNDKAPQTFEELWAGYDPRKEPLETEVLKEWEEDGVVLRVVRLRIGVFKGQKVMLAGVYGFPKGAKKLPGLLQIHGGGQYADYKAPLTNAKRGYATISIAWAGRISAPGYSVNPDVVALFWAGKTDDPKYRVTTDWGALDAYHAPCRNPKNHFANVAPEKWTFDAVESPRNNPWFLCTLAARRALTFLERQPEVDPARLGVYGHSMGGKLTVMTAGSDARIKAAAPSCGGISNRPTDNALYAATIADGVYLRHVTCPIVFLSPANDFHGHINDLETALGEIKSDTWRLTCAAHHNHQDTEPFQVAGPLWFDQHLKGTFRWPKTPETTLTLKTASGVPAFLVKPDLTKKPLSVDIFYTQQGQVIGNKSEHENTIARFWRHAPVKRSGDAWTAELPVLDTERPLWAYANVLYPLETPVTAAGYYYGTFTAATFNVSSIMRVASPEQMKTAGVKATDRPSLVIESFAAGWRKEWFTYDLTGHWARRTHKLYDPKWKAPAGAKLALDVRCERPNKLVFGLDDAAAEVALNGGAQWQRVVLTPGDFKNVEGRPLADWSGIRELRLTDGETLTSKGKEPTRRVKIGAPWQGAPPEFRNLRWQAGGSPAKKQEFKP
jgi:cephalosporin-C deacetylase-like acetyl esterase